MRTIKSFLKRNKVNFILLLGVLVVFFMFAEIILRFAFGPLVVRDAQGVTLYVDDNDLGHKMRPNFSGRWKGVGFDVTISTNEKGFRSSEFSLRDENVIFMLGDSFVAGEGVEDDQTNSFFLQEIVGDQFQVYNLGVPGYAQRQHVVQLERMLSVYDPEIVVEHIYIGNDITDNCGSLNRLSTLSSKEKAKNFLKKSRAIFFLYKKSLARFRQPSYLTYLVEGENPGIEKCFSATQGYLEEIKDLTDQHDVELLVVFIGKQEQTDKEFMKEVIDWYDNFDIYDESSFNINRINDRLVLMCEELQMNCLDFTQEFLDSGKGKSLYVANGHWNKQGHEFAAEIIGNYLKSRKIIE